MAYIVVRQKAVGFLKGFKSLIQKRKISFSQSLHIWKKSRKRLFLFFTLLFSLKNVRLFPDKREWSFAAQSVDFPCALCYNPFRGEKMKKSTHSVNKTFADYIINSLPAMLVVAAMAICMGVFFIVSQRENKPIERAEAISYSGTFQRYESLENYCTIYFEDGSEYSVYPHTESEEFRQTMMSLDKGTKLYILVNPNNECVIEIKTDTEELLNFELSQEAIDKYDNGYIAIGYFSLAAGVFFIIYPICSANYKRKENARHAGKSKGANSPVLRHDDPTVKSRILAKATVEGYKICYRRVKSVNELVINGRVYDEKKGVIEFAHKLCASIDGHSFEAGMDESGYSYIMFDGEIIEYKKRWI